MTNKKQLELSRRKVLGGLGTIGVASVGAGLGTTAFFSDEETFEDNTLTAGFLDLKVDWEEHYADWSADEEAAVSDVVMPTSGGTLALNDYPDDYVGLPDPENAMIAVPSEDVAPFMDATAVEAFPDPDNDGAQEIKTSEFAYEPCADGADLEGDLDPKQSGPAVRTDNDDTYDASTGTRRPLINLTDVKPGDFGEVTFSFHLCDNPGYIWIQGANVSQSGGVNPEPEQEAEGDDNNDANLAANIQTVWWYDSRGDNVLQTNCPEKLYLVDSVEGDGTTTRLFEVDIESSEARLEQLLPNGQSNADDIDNGNFDQTDAIAATSAGDEIIFYDRDTAHLGVYDVGTGAFSDRGAVSGDPGGVVLAGYSPSGVLWAASQETDQLYTVDPSSPPSVTAQGDTGITLEGADLVFASDGTLYVWTSDSTDQGLYKVNDPSSDTTAVPVDSSNIGNQDARITGLAIRDAGTGNLVASDRDNDEIVEIDRTDGSIVQRYPMKVPDGSGGFEDYQYDFGDMTAGAVCGEVFRRGTLASDLDALKSGNGIPLDGNRASSFVEIGDDPTSGSRECFVPGVNHYIGFAWWLPTDVGNEVQGDTVTFDLGFYTEQCRHNDGSGQADESA